MNFTEEDKRISRGALRMALAAGAGKARVSLAKSCMDLVANLNGEVDKLSSCLDCSLDISLFVDGRFGSFSTNRLEEQALKTFIRKAVESVRMLAPEAARDLPAPERQVKNALTGLELEAYDMSYPVMDAPKRQELALAAAIWPCEGKGWKLLSEEGEYSDSLEYTLIMDSNGLEAVHCESCFSYGVEITIEDSKGRKYSGYWWDSSPFLPELNLKEIGSRALELAVAQIGSRSVRGGKYNLVADREVSSRLVTPLLQALGGYSIQQNNSFLLDSVGKQLFPAELSLLDCPHIKGQNGSRLFDSEGVATKEHYIIENGLVKEYFLNTFTANKLGLSPTQEEAIRPCLPPCRRDGLAIPEKFGAEELMSLCGSGILVNDFNGGNSNSATGDFSYGIEGYLFKDGKILRPVSGMLITGNFLTLWSRLLAAGNDPRPCREKLIPSLAFKDVDFSG